MKREFYKIDAAYPFFCAMVVSAFICVLELFPRLSAHPDCPGTRNELTLASEGPSAEISPEKAAGVLPETVPSIIITPSVQLSLASADIPLEQDEILAAYRDPESRDYVAYLFSEMARSQELAQAVLSNADIFNIPPSLAFALCWEESRFKARAVNRKNRNGSTDRGLFQLNDNSFPHLGEKEIFDPRINSYYGLSHLRWCLDTAGSLVAGLAMYNAGTSRVRSGGTPKTTLDYVSNILDSKQRIEALFEEYRPKPSPVAMAAAREEEAEPETRPDPPKKARLAFLSPPR